MLEVNFDITELLERYSHLSDEIEKATSEGIARLSLMTHAHITERAQEKLHSTRDLFFSKFKPLEQVDATSWLITIPKEISWIENGINAGFDMLPGMLASPKARTGKNGKYLIVPFKHNSSPRTPTQELLNKTLKSELTKKKIPYQKIEKNPDGSAKSGLLHKLNAGNPTAPKPNGKPWQPDHYSGPILQSIRVYQHKVEHAQTATVSVKKDIMTFRTASQSQAGQKWIHPGFEPQNFLTEAKDWAEKEWETSIMPEIMKDLGI